MNPHDVLIAASAVGAYGASSAIQIELRDGRRMTAVGAFGPALVALGGSGFRIGSLSWLVTAGLVAEVVGLIVTRQRMRLAAIHALALMGAAAVFGAVAMQRTVTGRPALLIATALSSLIYLAIDAVRAGQATDTVGRLWDRLVEAAPAYAVLVSTAGLTVLVLPSLGWATFPIVFVPLLAAAHEFGNFGKTRRTFDETVRALASLVEGAGYAADGHHARVADLSVAMAKTAGLSSKQIRELQLVALLHDVGAVSLTEPAELRFTDPRVVAERSAEFVEETGYLAGHGRTVLEASTTPSTVEAAILHVADVYDRLNPSSVVNPRALESALDGLDPSLQEALRTAVSDFHG